MTLADLLKRNREATPVDVPLFVFRSPEDAEKFKFTAPANSEHRTILLLDGLPPWTANESQHDWDARELRATLEKYGVPPGGNYVKASDPTMKRKLF